MWVEEWVSYQSPVFTLTGFVSLLSFLTCRPLEEVTSTKQKVQATWIHTVNLLKSKEAVECVTEMFISEAYLENLWLAASSYLCRNMCMWFNKHTYASWNMCKSVSVADCISLSASFELNWFSDYKFMTVQICYLLRNFQLCKEKNGQIIWQVMKITWFGKKCHEV